MNTETSITHASPLDAEQLQAFADLLQKRRQLLQSDLRDRLLEAQQQGQSAGGGEVHDTKDASFLAAITEVRVAGAERQIQELRDIEAAHARIHGGVYGICSECGNTIPTDRLRVYPTAKRCTSCQQVREETQTRGHRS